MLKENNSCQEKCLDNKRNNQEALNSATDKKRAESFLNKNFKVPVNKSKK